MEKMFNSLICGDQLMVEPMAMSMGSWRMAVYSLVWSPPTRLTPG